jgi:hypothetical protein
LGLSDIQWRKFIHFLKSYLAIEEWFPYSNDKDEVNSSRGKISKVLTSIQKFFPRLEHTNGYRLPEMHGMTKMQSYIERFGSGMNFYGGPGEAAHKSFVKSAGQKTQRRVGKFVQQTAHQYYNYMLSTHAMQHLAYVSSCLIQSGTEDLARQPDIDTDEEDDVHINLSGKYELEVTPEIIKKIETDQTIDVVWLTGNAKKTNSGKYKLKKEVVQCLVRKINDSTEKHHDDCWSHKSHCDIFYHKQKKHLLFSSMLYRRTMA